MLALPASAVHAQDFHETMDVIGSDSAAGPSQLVARGWTFPRVLDPGLGHEPWRQGPWHAGAPAPHEGTGYLHGSVSVPPFASGNIVKWLILPTNQTPIAGKVASAWVRGMATGQFPLTNAVELRYSPSGGVGTGTTTSSVGDFTVVLAGNSNSILSAWDHLQAEVPGNGRLAIRWSGFAPFSFSGTTLELLVDDFSITGTGVTPPLPQPGETVHWTAAMSPIRLTNQQVIPAGGTLVIDAGVEIWFDFNSPSFTGSEMLALGGSIRFEGTAAQPVRLRRGTNTPNIPSVSVGSGLLATVGTPARLDADFVDSDISIGGWQSAFMRVRNSTFHRTQPIDWTSQTDAQRQTPIVGGGKATIEIRDCVFHNAIVHLSDALALVTGCTFDDAKMRVERFPMSQTHAISGNTFINSPRTAAMEVDGYGYHVAQNSITGALWPLQLNGAGLTPDSVLPEAGNLGNRIPFGGGSGSEIVGPVRLPRMAVPYLVRTQLTAGNQYDSKVTFEAGATVEMGPNAGILFEGSARTEVRGTPEAPVRFVPEVSGQRWVSLSTASVPPVTFRNAQLEGGRWALGGVDTLYFVHDCELRGNEIGVQVGDYCGAVVSKTRFVDNGIGCLARWAGSSGIDQGRFFDYGAANPNSFEGTGTGAGTEPPTTDFSSMRHAWWGAPSGPQHWTNPGGQGAPAGEWVTVVPFRATTVDFTDHPPVVDVMPIAKRQLRAGDRIILHWAARDAGAIVSQRLEFRPNSGFDDGVVAVANIPPSARSLEYVIPDTRNGDPVLGADLGLAVFRLIAVDERGQEGWDDFHWTLAPGAPLDVSFTGDFSQVRRVGENFDVPVSLGGILEYRLYADDIADDVQFLGASALGNDAGGLGAASNTMPAISSDLVRYSVSFSGKEFYSPYFTIRARTEFGDAPPTVSLTSPAPGMAFRGGAVVSVRWTASDAEALRDFDLQASYDGGRTWHPFALGLPAGSRSFDWRLPASSGISDVRVRVIARDTRFQVESDGSDRAFSITPGDWPAPCMADLNGDGIVNGIDLGVLLGSWGSTSAGDVNGDGAVNGADLGALLGAWGACR